MTTPGAPLPGGPALVLVGNNGDEGAEHGFLWLNRGNAIEGGQVTRFPKKKGKGYRISKAGYEFEMRAPDSIWARRVTPNLNAWRRIRAYVSLDALPFTGPTCLPEGA